MRAKITQDMRSQLDLMISSSEWPMERGYEPLLTGLRAMTALLVLRDKAIKPLLAAAQPLRPKRGVHNPKPIDLHYDAIQAAMKGVFHELGLTA